MKKGNILLVTLIIFMTISFGCSKSDEGIDSDTNSGTGCGTYNGHSLHKGPQGGCFYYNSNGNKTYVDASYCNC